MLTHTWTLSSPNPARLLFAVVTVTLLAALSVAAQAKLDLVVSLTAKKVLVNEEGKETLQLADRAKPGETIQYDAIYQNKGRKGLRHVQPTLPIPVGLEFIADTALPRPTLASLDGKAFEKIPLKRKIVLPDGRVEEREVPASEYRALRWSIGDMAPGVTVAVVARARLVGE